MPARRLRHAGARRHAAADRARARSATSPSTRTTPSPFAASLLFGYVANYIYDGDAPLAERRAQALAIDQAQLRELLGEAELRELLDADAMADVERQLQQLDERLSRAIDRRRPRSAAAPRRSDRRRDRRAQSTSPRDQALDALWSRARAVVAVSIAGDARVHPGRVRRRATATRSACRCRRGCRIAARARARCRAATSRGATRARTGRSRRPSSRRATGSAVASAEALLKALAAGRRLLEGEFRPGGTGREWCDPDVLQTIRRRSLAQAAQGGRAGRPAGPRRACHVAGRASSAGAPASTRCSTRSRTCRARRCPRRSSRARSCPRARRRLHPRRSRRADRRGRSRLARRRAARRSRRPRRALPHRSPSPRLWRPPVPSSRARRRASWRIARPPARARRVVLRRAPRGRGRRISRARRSTRCGISCGRARSPTTPFTRCARSRARRNARSRKPARGRPAFRSRRIAPPSAEGRWSLSPSASAQRCRPTRNGRPPWRSSCSRATACVTREVAAAEGIVGGFGAVYDVLKALEDAGRVRRGYFVAGVGATQFALPAGARPPSLAA